MHPAIAAALILAVGWFFTVGLLAKRGLAISIGLGIAGIPVFLGLFVLFDQIMRQQDFFLAAIRSGPDIGPILIYVVGPAALTVVVCGLGLWRLLGSKGGRSADS
jgi:hypothetical protein